MVVDARWSLRVNSKGKIILAFGGIPLTKETEPLLLSTKRSSRFVEWLTLDGMTADGRRVSSDKVILNRRAMRFWKGWRPQVILEGTASRLRVQWLDLPATNRLLRVSYLTVGLRGFGAQAAPTSVGRVTLAGQPRIRDFDRLAGQLDVHPVGRPSDLTRWLGRCDDLVGQLFELLSLAEGKTIGWSIRQLVRDDNHIIVSDLYGPLTTGDPYDPLGEFLDIQPWLDAAVTRYTKALRRRTGLDVAIRLMLFHPGHLEFQLIGAATALEHLVSVYMARQSGPRIVSSRTFASLQRHIGKAFELARSRVRGTRAALTREALQRLQAKIPSLNDPPFRDKLTAMLKFYRIPLEGLEKAIRDAILARNVMVHTGRYPEGRHRELYVHVVVLRETLKRIVLTLLKYEGSYHSMLNGPEWVKFPPGSTTLLPE